MTRRLSESYEENNPEEAKPTEKKEEQKITAQEIIDMAEGHLIRAIELLKMIKYPFA